MEKLAQAAGAQVPPEAQVPAPVKPDDVAEPSLVEQDLLVEDVSIDGMCGVY